MPGGKQQPPRRNDGWDRGRPSWEEEEHPARGEAGKAPAARLAGNTTSVLQGALHALPGRRTSPNLRLEGAWGSSAKPDAQTLQCPGTLMPGGPQSLTPFLILRKQWHLYAHNGFSVSPSPPQWPHSIPHHERLPQV